MVEKIGALLPPTVKWKSFFNSQAKNPRYLHTGDVVTATIATPDGRIDLGEQRNAVGLCAGLRDAHNLAWKLARVLQQGADERLLDTYESERAPHARHMIRLAVVMGWTMTGGQDRAVDDVLGARVTYADGALAAWLRAGRADGVLLRPDRVVLDTVPSGAGHFTDAATWAPLLATRPLSVSCS